MPARYGFLIEAILATLVEHMACNNQSNKLYSPSPSSWWWPTPGRYTFMIEVNSVTPVEHVACINQSNSLYLPSPSSWWWPTPGRYTFMIEVNSVTPVEHVACINQSNSLYLPSPSSWWWPTPGRYTFMIEANSATMVEHVACNNLVRDSLPLYPLFISAVCGLGSERFGSWKSEKSTTPPGIVPQMARATIKPLHSVPAAWNSIKDIFIYSIIPNV